MEYQRQYRAGDPTVIIGDDVDVCAKFDLLLCDDGTNLGAPTVKVNKAEVLGGDGTLDLSEAYQDDVLFVERPHDFKFMPWGPRHKGVEFEKLKSAMFALLLGKRLTYSTTLDPGYTFTGRWECTSAEPPYLEFHVDADPYKVGATMRYEVECAGGKAIEVDNGRRHVIPTITVPGPTLVQYGAKAWELPEAGTWTIDGFRLAEGRSRVYLNSSPTLCDTTLQDVLDMLDGMTWNDIPPMTRLSDHFFTKEEPPEGEQFRVSLEYQIQDL